MSMMSADTVERLEFTIEGELGDIQWRSEKRLVSELIEYEKNPRQLTRDQYEQLAKSLSRFGLADPLIINADNTIIGGHQRKRVLLLSHLVSDDDTVDVRVPHRLLSEREVEELNIRLNKNTGEWDYDILANAFDIEDLLDWGFSEVELHIDSLTDLFSDDPDAGEQNIPEQYLVVIECNDEQQQAIVLDQLVAQGYECRALTS